ncbi:hypothetical protein F511_37611 [Dorcoceras hygrometricum]|uniref:Uncharacterized protein n=1 Tax=Dorcoceras hygrometricum TaxID=472368 RepID=A0A2Z7BF67_9LAMI|nr:hypothetical protein F511_37611 [Dorcoceras hygrometricum]
MRANRSQQGDESAVLPLVLASWKLKSKPKVRSYQLIEALPETANARLLVLLRDPTSSLPHLPKVVSIGRATLKECSATGLAQNRDGKRWESTEKSYSEQCLGFTTENDNMGKYSKTIANKRPSRKNDRKVLVAEERNKNWADTDTDSSSSSSSSSDSEQEEVHCLMANQTSEDEVFNFSNTEFTREDLICVLNEMVQEYRKLSQTFEEFKAENVDLKNSSVEPRSVQLGKTDSLQIELSKLNTENESLRIRSSELESEIEKLKLIMSSWTRSSVSVDKLCEIQKPANDRTGLVFNSSESSTRETITQSYLAYDKFKKMSFVKAIMTHDTCESVRYDDSALQS